MSPEIINIIKLAQAQKWEGVSEAVEQAKGSRKYCRSYSEIWTLIKRQIRLQWHKKSGTR